MQKFTAIVLAAGKGVRMKSQLPKVLQELMGKPLIYYVLRELFRSKRYIKQIVVVLGHAGEKVEKTIKSEFSTGQIKAAKLSFVYQTKLLGTADAVKAAAKKVKCENTLVICGDTPLITSRILSSFISFFLNKKLSSGVLTADIKEKNSLGLIVRDQDGRLSAIREKLSVTDYLSGPKSLEVNSGIYCFNKKVLLRNLPEIKMNKKKKEYFLTDIIEILYKQGQAQDSYFIDDGKNILGINSPKDLLGAQKVLQARIIERLIEQGVRVLDPVTTFIQEGVKVGKNTLIYPFTFIEKDVIIGSNCFLGPFIHIRKDSKIKDNSQLGNFLEINRSCIGKNARIKHFGYLGDAVIADNVNIGAGTVTANYDGKAKHKTQIKQGAFVGSDTIFVAPVKVGRLSTTGAGSVVTKDVKDKTVVVGVPAKLLKKKPIRRQAEKEEKHE